MIETFETTVSMPGLKLPARAIAVKGEGKLILISPIKFDDAQLAKLRAMGEVTDIVAPCLMHHLSIPRAIGLFPKATVWGVPGFEKKRPDIRWTKTLTPETWTHSDLLEVRAIEGSPVLNEVGFFHRASRTLIATDVVFNLRNAGGFAAPLLLRLLGTWERFAISRLTMMTVKDRAKFAASMARILEWDFDRVIMGHGEILATGGKAEVTRAMRERGLLEGASK